MRSVVLVLVAWCCLLFAGELEAQYLPEPFESLRPGDLIRLRIGVSIHPTQV